MFTGLIEEIGTVLSVEARGRAREFRVNAATVLADMKIDDSIAVNGVCLTVIAKSSSAFAVQAVDETMRKTNLGAAKKGDSVNLERAVRPSDRLGGHFVQGHVDAVAEIIALHPQDAGTRMSVKLPRELLRYVIARGSIALDGVSLTVAEIEGDTIAVALIPHTLQVTTLGKRRVGDRLNVEVDMIGRYIVRQLEMNASPSLTREQMLAWGY